MTRRVALRALSNGRLVCSDLALGEHGPLAANRDQIGPWETFELIELEPNGQVVVEPPPALPPAPSPGPAPISPPVGDVLDRLVRVTDERDGEIPPRQYSYWPHAVIVGGDIYVMACHPERPRFFKVSRHGHVERLGPLLEYRGTGEGWYFDAHGWIYLLNGPELRRVNPFSGHDRVVFSIRDTHPGCDLWQAHSSEDGETHSATVRWITTDGSYPRIGTVVWRHGRESFFVARGVLDESALTSKGDVLIIKEDEDNRIITLATGEERLIRDHDGAVGHSDCGDGFVVGEDNIHGACVLWDLRGPLSPDQRRELFRTWNMGHVSIGGTVCLSSDGETLAMVGLDGSGRRPFLAHGNRDTGDYDDQVKANLDPSGRIACYMSNAAGRRDVYLTPVPR